MGLIERIRNAVRTNLTELAERFEDPDERLGQFIGRIESDLGEARMELGAAVREEKRLEREFEASVAETGAMRERAKLALRAADEQLAREALRRSEAAREKATRAESDLTLQRDAARLFREHVAALEAKLAEARERLDTLKARKRLAEAQRAMARRLDSPDGPLGFGFQSRLDELEAEARAHQEIYGTALPDEDDRLAELLEDLRSDGRRPSGGEGA